MANNVGTQLQQAIALKETVIEYAGVLDQRMSDLHAKLNTLINTGLPEDKASEYKATYLAKEEDIISDITGKMRTEHVEYLDKVIENLRKALAASGGGGASSGNSKTDSFRRGIENTKRKMDEYENAVKMGAYEKWKDEKTHWNGMDAQEREYPHQGIIMEEEKKAQELEEQKRLYYANLMKQHTR